MVVAVTNKRDFVASLAVDGIKAIVYLCDCDDWRCKLVVQQDAWQ